MHHEISRLEDIGLVYFQITSWLNSILECLFIVCTRMLSCKPFVSCLPFCKPILESVKRTQPHYIPHLLLINKVKLLWAFPIFNHECACLLWFLLVDCFVLFHLITISNRDRLLMIRINILQESLIKRLLILYVIEFEMLKMVKLPRKHYLILKSKLERKVLINFTMKSFTSKFSILLFARRLVKF